MAWKSRAWPGEPGKSAGNLTKWPDPGKRGCDRSPRKLTKMQRISRQFDKLPGNSLNGSEIEKMARQSGKITRKSNNMVGHLGKRPGNLGQFWNPGKWPGIHANGREMEEMAGKLWKTGKVAGSVSSCVCSVCVFEM